MRPGHLKGALLEYIVREILLKCGFASVIPDGHYIYDWGGLCYINGKGAAHDADVLMEPPVQMPFSYPSRLLFECKAYGKGSGLGLIRNVLGLRYDINEFEIVTDDSIKARKNNRRTTYAISDRKRFYYQVGLASIQKFSTPAFEFAANNKIPLLSLRWLFPEHVCDLFKAIDGDYLAGIGSLNAKKLYDFFKERRTNPFLNSARATVEAILEDDDVIGNIYRELRFRIDNAMLGLLETGDIVFLFNTHPHITDRTIEILNDISTVSRIYYRRDLKDIWFLRLHKSWENPTPENSVEFEFHLPNRIMSKWNEFNQDKAAGREIKDEFFSRIIIFSSDISMQSFPFRIVYIDKDWLEELRQLP